MVIVDVGLAVCPLVRYFTHITPIELGVNEYLTTGIEGYYCQC